MALTSQLYSAAANGKAKLVRELLSKGVQSDTKNIKGETPL